MPVTCPHCKSEKVKLDKSASGLGIMVGGSLGVGASMAKGATVGMVAGGPAGALIGGAVGWLAGAVAGQQIGKYIDEERSMYACSDCGKNFKE